MQGIYIFLILLDVVGCETRSLYVKIDEVLTICPKTNWLGVKPPMFCKPFFALRAQAPSGSQDTSNVLLKPPTKLYVFYNTFTKW